MNIRILHTYLLQDPFPNVENMRKPGRSPSPIKNSQRQEAIQHLEMLQKCRNEGCIIEATQQQKAKKQAMAQQILGDSPNASQKPSQNILFGCKINSITQEKNLQVIFSRFGPVKNRQSLQYGFIKFQSITSCEQAYIEMDNVIIDDRRIQVDFSQSLSKLLHHNHKPGLMESKPKYGQPSNQRRQLLPKSFTEGKNKNKKYDFVVPASKGVVSKTNTKDIMNSKSQGGNTNKDQEDNNTNKDKDPGDKCRDKRRETDREIDILTRRESAQVQEAGKGKISTKDPQTDSLQCISSPFLRYFLLNQSIIFY